MAMKFTTGKTPTVVLSTLSAVDKRMTEAAQDEFNSGAMQIQAAARQFAPVDHGDLEAAIKVSDPVRSGSNAVSRTIYIDTNGLTRTDVADYAPVMHEGSYKLGPKSQAKAAALGVMVGPKFLTRAANLVFPRITKAIAAALNRTAK
jgi:hypothetical protein